MGMLQVRAVTAPTACPSTTRWGDRAEAGQSRSIWSAKRDRQVLAFVLTAGQAGDSPQMIPVLQRIRASRPKRVLADKEYSSRANRTYLARRGINALKDKCSVATRYSPASSRSSPTGS